MSPNPIMETHSASRRGSWLVGNGPRDLWPVVAAVALALVCGCVQKTTTVGTTAGEGGMVRTGGDTVSYYLQFGSPAERDSFMGSFERTLAARGHVSRTTDMTGRSVWITVLPTPDRRPPDESPGLLGQETRSIQESTLLPPSREVAAAPASFQSPAPGGTVVWYGERRFLDERLSGLCQGIPFDSAAGCPQGGSVAAVGCLVPSAVSDRRITLDLADSLRNSAGQIVSSFDLVVQWTAFIKEHPAEGLALFRYVKGVDEYIRGREGVIAGFAVSNPRSVTLVLDRSDPEALARLCTPRLLPANVKVGPYAVKSADAQLVTMVPNKRTVAAKPFLDQVSVVFGRDRNPFLAYSLNKYDCVLLTARKDLDYARRTTMEKSQLVEFGQDRYFVSVNIDPVELRAFVGSLLNGRDMLGAVRVEGEVIRTIVPVPAAGAEAMPPAAKAQMAAQPLRVLYRSDDPLSVLVAEKLLADLKQKGLPCELKGETATGYERLLVTRDYALAVGWVDGRIATDRSEQLRLSTLWFADQDNEARRLADMVEVPLFAVRIFALCRSDIRFVDGTVAGVYRSAETAQAPR